MKDKKKLLKIAGYCGLICFTIIVLLWSEGSWEGLFKFVLSTPVGIILGINISRKRRDKK